MVTLMKKVEIQVAYDGADMDAHSMDVDKLAPALLAIGGLCKEANRLINGDRATVKVLVQSDFKHKCFLVGFEVIQDSIFSHLKSLFENDKVETAEHLMTWLGFLGTPVGGLWWYLKQKRGKKIKSVSKIDDQGLVSVQFEGDGNQITIHQNVFILSQNQAVLDAAKGVLQPTQTPGIDSVEFRESDSENKSRVVEKIEKAEAADIIEKEKVETVQVETEPLQPQTIDARLIVYGPKLDEKPKQWTFTYNEKNIVVDISESGIADDVLQRGRVNVGDAYLVKLEISEHKTETGGYRPAYRVIGRFKEFLPAPQQMRFI